MLGVIISFSTVQPSHYPWNNRTSVGAYRIRPSRQRGCISNGSEVFAVIVAYSPTSGRMRYAPTPLHLFAYYRGWIRLIITPVRLIFGVCWVACCFHFRPHQGVCDMPLHLFVYCRGQIQLIIIPVRLIFGICWFACWFRFRPRQGVCDTPLHLFVYCRGQI